MDKGGSMHRINCHLLLEKLLDSGLSSCAAQRFEFLLTLTVASETKTWSPKKQVKLVLNWTVFMRWLGFWLFTRDGRLKAGLLRDCCHPNNLFLGLDLWYKDMVWPKKKEKRKKLFQALDCLYVLIRILTLHKRWKTKCWAFKGSVSPKKYLP